MKPGGRLAAAIEILADIEARHRPVAEALRDWGLSHRFAGSSDRAAIGNMVYDTLRWRSSSAWIMADETPRAVALATIARRWGLGATGLAAWIADDTHAPGALTPTEADRLDKADISGAPAHIRADIPQWLASRFEGLFGPDWVAEGEALALRPPLDMRVNRLKADRAKVLKPLARFDAAETSFSPDGLRIPPAAGDRRHPNIQIEPAFQKGWVEIQDEGSQIAAHLVGLKPGDQVLDFCAGSGGKTLALAAVMANQGQIFATDSDRSRLAPIYARLKRAATRNVQVRDAGASLDDLAGRMDAVLVDAPCTGNGVWRRRPDAKWRLSPHALTARVAEQAALLAAAARYVRPGGRLVYVTCSLLADENADCLASFLAATPEFRSVAPAEAIAASAVSPGLAQAALLTETGVILSPRRTGTDGFFIAVMRRQ